MQTVIMGATVFIGMIVFMVCVALLKNVIFNPSFYLHVFTLMTKKAKELKSDEHAIATAQAAVDELRKRGYVVVLQVSKEPVREVTKLGDAVAV